MGEIKNAKNVFVIIGLYESEKMKKAIKLLNIPLCWWDMQSYLFLLT